ncbi:hypothetical protein ABE26_15085 [Cytobacillus firmus]|nr:hypothetical protein [Cytobacillus firmus]
MKIIDIKYAYLRVVEILESNQTLLLLIAHLLAFLGYNQIGDPFPIIFLSVVILFIYGYSNNKSIKIGIVWSFPIGIILLFLNYFSLFNLFCLTVFWLTISHLFLPIVLYKLKNFEWTYFILMPLVISIQLITTITYVLLIANNPMLYLSTLNFNFFIIFGVIINVYMLFYFFMFVKGLLIQSNNGFNFFGLAYISFFILLILDLIFTLINLYWLGVFYNLIELNKSTFWDVYYLTSAMHFIITILNEDLNDIYLMFNDKPILRIQQIFNSIVSRLIEIILLGAFIPSLLRKFNTNKS